MNDTIQQNKATNSSDTIEKNCLVCNEIYRARSAKSKFCSEACKQRNKRDKTEIDHTKIKLQPLKEECPSNNPIDREYFNYRAERGLMTHFDPLDYSRVCIVCKKQFKTRLQLMKYCSFNCHDLF